MILYVLGAGGGRCKMRNSKSNKYGTITRQYIQRDDNLYTVLYEVEYGGEKFKYISDAQSLGQVKIILYGINQWYMDTCLLCPTYSIPYMRQQFSLWEKQEGNK